jgi:hypothetical protein
MKYIILFLFIISSSLSFSQKYSIDERAALLNLNGYNVTNHSRFNDRLFQKFKIENLKKNPDIIVLGTSRVRSLNEKTLNEKKIINNGMTRGTLKDIISLYYIYRTNGFKPKEIYIGTDPWIIDSIPTDLWKFLEKDYNEMYQILLSKNSFKNISAKKYNKITKIQIEELYNPLLYKFKNENFTKDYSLDSIFKPISNDLKSILFTTGNVIDFLNKLVETSSLYDTLLKKKQIVLNSTGECLVYETNDYRKIIFRKLKSYQKNNILKLNRIVLELTYSCPSANLDDDFPTLKDYNLLFTNLKNGSTTFNYNYEHRSVQQSDETVSKLKSELIPKCPNKDLFELFIDYILSEGIKINFILVPFHPVAYTSSEQYYIDRENYLLSFAKTRNIRVFGSFNPKNIGLDNSDFYDAVHVRNRSFKKVFDK